MIAALQRLKTSYEPQEATSMMAFCINGKSKSLSELFMTHPPLDKRIEALRSGEVPEIISPLASMKSASNDALFTPERVVA